MFKVGYRTLKTAVGVPISIALAQFIGLQSFASAGILTILCIQVTKKKSLKSSFDRFITCTLSMLFSFIFFEGVGYYPLTIGLLLLCFIPVAVQLKVTEGIISSTVIIMHIFMAGNFTMGLVLNELGIIVIGIGVALLVNLYMPSVEKELKQYQEEIETYFSKILKEIVIYLRTNDSTWDGNEITKTEEVLHQAKTLAFRDVENRFTRLEDHYYYYFEMREKQFETIERMLPIVTSIPHLVEQGIMIADFIEKISDAIHPGNTAILFLEELEELRQSFQEMELPTTREEFEARAALLQFLKEMEQYLMIKQTFMEADKKLS